MVSGEQSVMMVGATKILVWSAESTYGSNSYTSVIVPDGSCLGGESSFEECHNYESWATQDGYVVSVSCSGYPVRLIGPSRCAGRVEVYYSNGWQTVCDDGWDLNDAQVVCRQLGCGTALIATHSAYFGKGTDKIVFDDVACMGSETHLIQCSKRGYLSHDCTHNQDAGVICSGEKMFITVQLKGPTQCSGRVEIYNNRSWGTVCNNSWDINDARVVCRQLDCGTALSVLQFGEGAGEINEANCAGSERYLSECGIRAQTCNHSQDAGVICSGLTKPHISINPPGNITFGQNVTVSCSIPDGQQTLKLLHTEPKVDLEPVAVKTELFHKPELPKLLYGPEGFVHPQPLLPCCSFSSN
ncbi:deleted in malignant brain tumors 1 protein-like [Fundulus heteroclitus]|uniref:deleted in malignant brain tumors 1 protein-like n=1 Tax=Fundulus heteroclitus TaxID=8078 RepID=UPI00165B572F|nr:deleted in malignant brain tumors 1 protein-like [Fundulus heteroclitus]